MNTKGYWHNKAKDLNICSQAFINGKYVDAQNGETLPCYSPIDGRKLADISCCSKADIDLAVQVARETFETGIWSQTSPTQRKKVLMSFANLILENAEELALLETLDMGKPIMQSLNVDVRASARCVQWYAEAIDKVYDQIAPSARDIHATITREPIGVVAAVVPWNFPLVMATWKYAPILATGNSVIIKPASASSLSVIYIASLAKQAGIPDGVFNVVTGRGSEIGKLLGLHPDIDMLTFTGSTEVGKLFMQYSGQSNLKNISVECGGKSPHIITAQCNNLDEACQAVTAGIFYNQGEVCTAGSRLIVDAKIKEKVVAKIRENAKAYYPNHPLDENTTFGAIVNKQQMNGVLDYILKGQEEGATLSLGGKQVMSDTGGFYIEPTILENVTNNMCVAQEEIFGPVLSVIAYDTIDQAIEIANDSPYGLAAGVWSDDANIAYKVSQSLRAGIVHVNCWDQDDMATPFGGYKQSGIGRDKSLHALEKYTELKSTLTKYKL